MDVSKWFPVHVRLRPSCVTLAWLFNEYTDDLALELNAIAWSKRWCEWREV